MTGVPGDMMHVIIELQWATMIKSIVNDTEPTFRLESKVFHKGHEGSRDIVTNSWFGGRAKKAIRPKARSIA